MRHKGRQVTSCLTSNGRIKLARVRWHCPEAGTETPLDRLIDQAEQTFSRGVVEMLCRLNLSSPSFARTAENVGRLTPIEISGESVRRLVEAEGKAAANVMRRGRLDPGFTSADCQTDQGLTRLYFGCDGVKVPLVTDAEKRKRRQKIKQKRQRSGRKRRPLPALKPGVDQSFKEFRIITAYSENQSHRIVAVTSGDHEAAGRLMRNIVLRVKAAEAVETIAVIDGAPWIRNQLELHGIAQHIGLDFYHLKDYAQRTRREVYGEENPEGREWIEQLIRRLLEQDVDAALDRLWAWRKGLRGSKRKAADKLLGYIVERRGIIRYREFRENHWQIGSGPTEAQCKTTTLRVKGRGRRWDKQAAEGIMALAALEAGGQWNDWWTTSETAAA